VSQDCRNSVFQQPIFIAQYHDLAQKMTFKPCATIFFHYLTNYIPGTFSNKQSHKMILSLLLWSCPKARTAVGPLPLALCCEDRAQVTFFGPSPSHPPPGGQGRTGKRKSKKQRRQRRTQDGRWPQVPSTRQIFVQLHLMLPRKASKTGNARIA
jgi:hypothetical protein